ncbi:MAG: GGDEF domain-containing protein [Microthrixaceae bacterium]
MSSASPTPSPETFNDPVRGIDELPYGFIAVGLDLKISYASRGAHDLLGYAQGDIVGRSAVDRLHPEDFARIIALFEQMAADTDGRRANPSAARHVELSVRVLDGRDRWISVGSTGRLLGEDGPFFLALRPNQVDRAMDDLVRGLALGDPTDDLLDTVTGLASAQYPGEQAWIVSRLCDDPPLARGPDQLHPSVASASAATTEAVQAISGESSDHRGYWAAKINDACGRRVGSLVVSNPDWGADPTPFDVDILTQTAQVASLVLQRETESQALELALATDQLTGANNRATFESQVAQLDSSDLPVAVLYVDLDRFKAINDSHGHAFGDRVLRDTVDRIRASIRADDMLARLGGDEFAVLCRGVDIGAAHHLLARVRCSLNDPAANELAPLGLGASVGMATAHSEAELTEIIERADAEMYLIKHAQGPELSGGARRPVVAGSGA